jgi:CHAP domain
MGRSTRADGDAQGAGTRRVTGARPRVTGAQAAAPDERATTDTGRSRAVSRARRITAHDRALVERTTQIIDIVEVVDADLTALQPWEEPTSRLPVTVIPPAPPSALQSLPSRLPVPWIAAVARVTTPAWARSALVLLVALAGLAGALGSMQQIDPNATYSSYQFTALQYADPQGGLPIGPALGDPWATAAGADLLGIGGGAGPGVKAPGSAGLPVKTPPPPSANQPPKPTTSGSGSGIAAAPFYPWPPRDAFMYVPGHPAFGMSDVGGYYYWAFGQCTWWAQYERKNENLTHMGAAMYWAAGAARRGYRVGSTPRAGATVVFQPGVQGAGGAGHVAHVIAVYPGGWFLQSEMNFYWNGGGWGRVDYRYAHVGWGVAFIY